MADATTHTKECQKLRMQPRLSRKDYKSAWLALEKMGKKINQLYNKAEIEKN